MFTLKNDICYQMPVHFGGYAYQPTETCYHDVHTMTFTYTTDGERLSEYIPKGFELLRPELSISMLQCREVDWLAGGAYNLIDVSAPVRFHGRRDRIDGNFSLVVWENKTAPILTGREQTGVAKIYADIEDLHRLHDKRFTSASYEGNTFLRLEMSVDSPLSEARMAQLSNVPVNGLHWRYIPKVGGPGAELSQPIVFPQRQEAHRGWQGSGAVQWTPLCYEQCPTQAHIISALAALPLLAMSTVTLTQGVVFLMAPLARVLE